MCRDERVNPCTSILAVSGNLENGQVSGQKVKSIGFDNRLM